MSDSDMDDSFLLEALEKIEQTQVHSSGNTTLADWKGRKPNPISSASISVREMSCEQNPICENSKNNFRANLLKSIKICRSNSNSKSEINDQRNLFNKRKFDEKDLESFSELKHSIHSPNKNIDSLPSTSYVLKKQNVSDCKLLDSMKPPGSSFNSPVNSIVKKRKFPGPAGILPEWGHRGFKLNSTDCDTSRFENGPVEDSVCSQTTAQDFVSGPWKEMYLDLDNLINSRNVLQSHNIRYMLRKNALRSQTCIRKTSFLVVMVRSIDLSHQDATAVFHDETGEIQGTISENVLEKYGSYISPGAVFVLKDATILSPGLFQPGMGVMGQLKKHYLTITLNSIITIYFPNEDDQVQKIEVINLTKEGLKSLLSTDEGFREITELIENEGNVPQQQSLYENIGPEKNMNARMCRNQTNIPEYKSPVYNNFRNSANAARPGANFPKNNPNTTKAIPNIHKSAPNSIQPVPNSNNTSIIPKQSFDYKNPNIPKSQPNLKNTSDAPIPSSSTLRPQPKGAASEKLRTYAFNPSSRIPEDNPSNNAIKSATAAFSSLSDDEEFDSLLASINTDAL